MTPTSSIVVSTFNRLPLWRRTLWAICDRPPPGEFELVVCDDGSDQDVLGELKKYSPRLAWTFVRFDREGYEAATGMKKFFNNSSASTNVAVRHARGEYVFWQGNEVMPLGPCYQTLLNDHAGLLREGASEAMVMSTTYDVPQAVLDRLDAEGSNFSDRDFGDCRRFPLQSRLYRSDVTNYISLSKRSLWERLGGVDERYYAGYGAEDSDFVRRARTVPGFRQDVSPALSLHQSHGGRTCYYNPSPDVITLEREDEGRKINRKIYDAWDGRTESQHAWEWGTLGAGEVLSNWR